MFSPLQFRLSKSILLFTLFVSLYLTFTSALSLNVAKKKKDLNHPNHNHDHEIHSHTGVCNIPLYGENPYFTRRLYNLEEQLAQELTELLDDIKQDTTLDGVRCSQSLEKYLQLQKRDAETIEADRHQCSYGMQTRADIVAENPIFTLKMLRRLIINLQTNTQSLCAKTDEVGLDIVSKTISKVFKMNNLIPPEHEQLDVAIDAILTLVFVYRFNVSGELRVGRYHDYQTKARLDFEDIIEVLNWVLEVDETGYMTCQWLIAAEAALESDGDDEFSRKVLLAYWQKALGNFGKTSITQFKREFEQKTLIGQKANKNLLQSEKLCRGEYLDKTENIYRPVSSLVCIYRMHYITRIKVEILTPIPMILHFPDFLTNKEIMFIKYQSPSYTVKPWELDHEWDDSSRESYHLDHFTKLAKEAMTKNKDPILINLIAKVEAATKYAFVPKENASIFDKLLQTPISGYWNVELNHDYITGYSPNATNLAWSSFLMFLTDTHMGGYSIFPMLNVFAKPDKGSALYFVNYDYNGKPKLNEKVVMESCPVIIGVKEVAHIGMELNYEKAMKEMQTEDDADNNISSDEEPSTTNTQRSKRIFN